MARSSRVEQIAGKHRIECETFELDAVRPEDDVGLEIVADFADGSILEQRAQSLERRATLQLLSRRCRRQQIAAAQICVTERQVSRLPVRRRKGDADDRRAHCRRIVSDHWSANSPASRNWATSASSSELSRRSRSLFRWCRRLARNR